MLVVLEYLVDILRQREHKILTRPKSSREIRVSKKRVSKDE